MMNFRTTIKQIAYPFSISYKDHFLLLGSCFTENIGKHLRQSKFNASVNPFGILYNPVSIATHLNRIINKQSFLESTLFQHQSYWYSHLHHSSFSAVSKEILLKKIKEQDQKVREDLEKNNRLIISFGTAKIYHHKAWNGIVASCHKLPMQAFDHRLLKVQEIKSIFIELLQKLKVINPDLQVLFTLSPVRHIRDGIIENQRSKATLLLAIHEICDQIKSAHYFPAYELLTDDLRDYRFYEGDLVHPSVMAIDYIWDYFQQSLFDPATQNIHKRIMTLRQAAAHRAFHPESVEHQQFLKKQLEKLESLRREFPFLDLEEEKKNFQEQQFIS